MEKYYDAAVIGAGVCGAAIAYELSKYDISVCVLEREPDAAMGTTKANSGIIHAGYDAPPGTLMAKYNVAGAAMIPGIAKKLSVGYKQIGSLVVAFEKEQLGTLEELRERGDRNGAETEIISGAGLFELEPGLRKTALAALWAPAAGVVTPWDLCLAFCETAAVNGTDFYFSSPVTRMRRQDGAWEIDAGKRRIRAARVFNAAGLYADRIAEMAGGEKFEIRPVKGQYFLLDRSQGRVMRHVVFQCPSAAGKGVLVSPTVDGNLIIGPDAEPTSEREDTGTDPAALAYVRKMAQIDTDAIDFRENIRNFAGLRAYSDREDFIIGQDAKEPTLFNAAGIKSPGLTSAAAIGPDAAAWLAGSGIRMERRKNFRDSRKRVRFSELSPEERAALIAEDPDYAVIVCRCNTVTLGEVKAAFDSPLPPTTLDGVKRRCGCGMGRCQGGFCSPIVHRLISERMGIRFEQVEKEKEGSYIVCGPTKGEER